MKIHLIKGNFTSEDAISIISKMIDFKIKFQEGKIKKSNNEVEIKMRENLINLLQKELYESRQLIEKSGGTISLQSEIELG